MASRVEYINVSGLRVDGRRPREVRRVRCQLGLFPRADGSALFEQGNTKVLAVVHGPRQPERAWTADRDAATITCEYSIAAFAASGRVRRRPGDRRAIEAATALRQSLESAVLLRLYPNSEIEVHVQVLQSDGGALAAAVNAATLALIDAGVAMSDYVVGCGVAYIQRTPLLDPNHAEASSGGAELVMAALPRSGKVTLVTMDARMPLDALEPLVDVGLAGCRQIHDIMRTSVAEVTARRLESREAVGS